MNNPAFDSQCAWLFHTHSPRLLRYFDRLSGDAELAADLTQETFVRLFRRRTMPEHPEAWLLTVAMNLFRNAQKSRARRLRLLTPERSTHAQSDPPPDPSDTVGQPERERVRAVLAQLPEISGQLLLLRAEGYSYRELAAALNLNEASVGTLLARAKQAFRAAYESPVHAP
jgi:RNA polymerase sigma-70 factor (ECF subfamily)